MPDVSFSARTKLFHYKKTQRLRKYTFLCCQHERNCGNIRLGNIVEIGYYNVSSG